PYAQMLSEETLAAAWPESTWAALLQRGPCAGGGDECRPGYPVTSGRNTRPRRHSRPWRRSTERSGTYDAQSSGILIQPWRMAYTTACVRSLTESLRRMLDMWFLTVCSLMPSA